MVSSHIKPSACLHEIIFATPENYQHGFRYVECPNAVSNNLRFVFNAVRKYFYKWTEEAKDVITFALVGHL